MSSPMEDTASKDFGNAVVRVQPGGDSIEAEASDQFVATPRIQALAERALAAPARPRWRSMLRPDLAARSRWSMATTSSAVRTWSARMPVIASRNWSTTIFTPYSRRKRT